MSRGHRLMDSDCHILEPPDLFEKYLEPQFRSHMPRAAEELLGLPDVSDESKGKIMWDNALKLYPIQPE